MRQTTAKCVLLPMPFIAPLVPVYDWKSELDCNFIQWTFEIEVSLLSVYVNISHFQHMFYTALVISKLLSINNSVTVKGLLCFLEYGLDLLNN